jgi:hypothetical protein
MDGEHWESERVGAMTLMMAVALPPPSSAGKVATILAGPPTDTPLTGNEADVALAGMVTSLGAKATPGVPLANLMFVATLRAGLMVAVRLALVQATMSRGLGVSEMAVGGQAVARKLTVTE